MIVQVIYVKDIAVFDAERYPPIPRHRYCIITPKAAGQLMQLITRSIHVLWCSAEVQIRKNTFQLAEVCRVYTPGPATFMQVSETPVPKDNITVRCYSVRRIYQIAHPYRSRTIAKSVLL